jgi:pyruvate dehydrogenase E2 component (dihydrolipoamide acetyltransferase)
MDIRIPNLGEGAESGNVVNIFVKVGDAVAKDQTLIELENEKAVAPIPSTAAGTVQKVLVKVGDKVSVGQAIVSITENGGASPAPTASVVQKAPSYDQAVKQVADMFRGVQEAGPEGYVYSSPSGMPPPASPTVRKVAEDLGIDLRRVKGSEAGGRIVMADLKDYIARLQQLSSQPRLPAAGGSASDGKTSAEKIDFSKWGPVQKKTNTSLRQKIAQKMSESWTTIPHVTQFDEADVTALMAMRKKAAPAYEKKGAALTITPFIMKAVVAALKKYPIVNSSLDETSNETVYKEYYHLGIAVDTEAGLIVPVIRDADKKSLLQLAKELAAVAEKTRKRKVSVEDLRGGSFTISNLGSIGGTYFTPIINKPEVAILGVGRGVHKPVYVKSGTKQELEPRVMLPLGLSYDHRVVDGADGARFIREIVANLENFKPEDVQL